MNGKEQAVLTLEGVLDIARVGELKGELAERLEARDPLLIEAEEVERVDGAVLQLLCAFRQAATVVGMDVTWGNVSPPFREAAELTGLAEPLGAEDGF